MTLKVTQGQRNRNCLYPIGFQLAVGLCIVTPTPLATLSDIITTFTVYMYVRRMYRYTYRFLAFMRHGIARFLRDG